MLKYAQEAVIITPASLFGNQWNKIICLYRQVQLETLVSSIQVLIYNISYNMICIHNIV